MEFTRNFSKPVFPSKNVRGVLQIFGSSNSYVLSTGRKGEKEGCSPNYSPDKYILVSRVSCLWAAIKLELAPPRRGNNSSFDKDRQGSVNLFYSAELCHYLEDVIWHSCYFSVEATTCHLHDERSDATTRRATAASSFQ